MLEISLSGGSLSSHKVAVVECGSASSFNIADVAECYGAWAQPSLVHVRVCVDALGCAIPWLCAVLIRQEFSMRKV